MTSKPEGRKALKDRLVREGRWESYVKDREQLRTKYPLDEANARAAELYAPLPQGMTAAVDPGDSPRPKRSGAPDAKKIDPSIETTAETFKNKGTPTSREVLQWVADNYNRADVTAEEAPSGAAWNLMVAVRAGDRMQEIFWGQMFTKLLPSQKDLDEQSKFGDKGQIVLNVIDAALLHDQLLASRQSSAPTQGSKPATLSRPPSPALTPSPGPASGKW